MSTRENYDELVHYVYHADTLIHEYIFHADTRQAVEVWYEQLKEAYQFTVDNQMPVLRILVDLRHAPNPPLTYAFQQAKSLQKQFPIMPPRRVVFLGTGGGLLVMLKPFVKLLRSDLNYDFFPTDRRTTALEWLLN